MSDTSQTSSRRPLMATLFTDHPASVNETYLGHMRFALGFAGWLGIAAAAAVVHAMVPAMCKTTASRILKRLYSRIEVRH